MTEKAGYPLSASRARSEVRQRRVVGKAQLAASAAGMLVVLAMLGSGRWLEAATVLLLTLGLLEILLQRALVLFHGGMRTRPARRRPGRRKAARTLTAAE